jgi:hypothetical protein
MGLGVSAALAARLALLFALTLALHPLLIAALALDPLALAALLITPGGHAKRGWLRRGRLRDMGAGRAAEQIGGWTGDAHWLRRDGGRFLASDAAVLSGGALLALAPLAAVALRLARLHGLEHRATTGAAHLVLHAVSPPHLE